MKKPALLSIVLIFVLSFSSFAQTKESLTRDKDKNATTSNTSIADSLRISKSLQLRPYKFNQGNLNIDSLAIVIDGKVSKHGYEGIEPNDIESIRVLKGEKAARLYSDQNGAGVIIITTRKKATEAKVEK